MDTLAQKKKIIQEAACTAGKFIRDANPKQGIVQKEGRGNFVTAADLASEKIIIDLIKKHFPEDSILSEETNNEIKDMMSVDHLWIIDPIDGTNNYANQRNYSCVAIGYAEKGTTKLGAIYNPFADEFFFAEKGKGAFVNNIPLTIGSQANIHQAVVATDNSYTPSIVKHHLELMLMIEPTPWVLLKGTAALMIAEVAAGRTDLYFHTDIHPWDCSGGFLLLEEAGGIVKNFKGESVTFNSSEIVVGNETLVNQFLRIINQTTPAETVLQTVS